MNVNAKRVIGLLRARKSNSQTKRRRQPSVSTPKNRNASSPISMKLKCKSNEYFQKKLQFSFEENGDEIT